MIRLPTAAVAALRDRLRERGTRPSISLPISASVVAADVDALLEATLVEQYGPLCEAMYLLMAADGQITGSERDVIRGAMRELDDRIRTRHVEAMLGAAADALVREGWHARLQAIGDAIGEDTARAEAAILLAAAVAYADGEIAPAENDVMASLMEVLGVDVARTHELVASLERVDEVLKSDERVDAADVVVHAASRLRTPEDFVRLAAETDRPDVTLVLRLYAAFVRSGDDLLDRGAPTPRSLSAARVEALGALADALPDARSPRLDELRAVLLDLSRGLAAIDRAPTVRALLDGALGDLEQALARTSALVAASLSRVGQPVPPSSPLDLRKAVEPLSRGAVDEYGRGIDRVASELSRVLPTALVAAVDLVLRDGATLPIEARDERGPAEPAPDPELPEWIPASRVVAGWLVHRPLGGGGSGSVFVASRASERDDPSAERFALKVPHYDALAARSVSEAEYLRTFKQEAGALLSLPDHPNLAGFVTFDARARPKPLLLMELVEGVDCHAVLQSSARLDPQRVVAILDGVLAGLAAMHEVEIGHLDVKPSNIVLRPSGEPVLVDFGLAGRSIRTGCATPTYAAPEVWGHVEDDGPASPAKADVYAFGCVAYELLAGRPLFVEPHVLALLAAHMGHDGDPEPIRELHAHPTLAPVGAWLSSCLRRSPKARATAEELREGLRAIAPRVVGSGWPLG